MLIQGQRLRGSDYFLADLVLHNAETTSNRGWVFQGHYDVMPARVGGLRHIGRAGICLGMGVAMRDPHDLETSGFGGQLDLKVLFRIERVQLGAVGDIAHGNKPLNA